MRIVPSAQQACPLLAHRLEVVQNPVAIQIDEGAHIVRGVMQSQQIINALVSRPHHSGERNLDLALRIGSTGVGGVRVALYDEHHVGLARQIARAARIRSVDLPEVVEITGNRRLASRNRQLRVERELLPRASRTGRAIAQRLQAHPVGAILPNRTDVASITGEERQ